MAILTALTHVTTYEYDRPVNLSPHLIRLRPAPHCRTPIASYALRVSPATHFVNWQHDPFGNSVARFVFSEQTRLLRVEVDLVAELASYNPFDFFLEDYASFFPFHYAPKLKAQLAPYLAAEPAGPGLQAFLAALPQDAAPTIDFLAGLNRRIARDIQYLIRPEPGVQSPDQTLERGSGSCRDSSWLLVEAARHLGLAARFVSGYLIQLQPDGPAGRQADFTDLHAWAEVFLPGAGWIGLDPTSGLLAGEGHVPLVATPHYSSAAPIEGMADVANVTFNVAMKLTRIGDAPAAANSRLGLAAL